MGHVILEFEDLQPYLLLKNGNYLYRIPYRDDWAVLKVYYGSRPLWETLAKSFGNVTFEGQTSYMPLTRRRIERECLDLWRHHGFRVFEVFDEVEVRAPQCPPGGYLLTEYVEATKLIDFMSDASIDADRRFETYRRFLLEWGRRHSVAVAEREPRLVHENGDAKHVMLLGEDFLWFDFEMVFRSRARVVEYVGHEIIQYLWNLIRHIPSEDHDRLLAETVEGYPDEELLRRGYDVFFRHPNPIHRLGRAVDRMRKKASKPNSKYSVARRLQTHL